MDPPEEERFEDFSSSSPLLPVRIVAPPFFETRLTGSAAGGLDARFGGGGGGESGELLGSERRRFLRSGGFDVARSSRVVDVLAGGGATATGAGAGGGFTTSSSTSPSASWSSSPSVAVVVVAVTALIEIAAVGAGAVRSRFRSSRRFSFLRVSLPFINPPPPGLTGALVRAVVVAEVSELGGGKVADEVAVPSLVTTADGSDVDASTSILTGKLSGLVVVVVALPPEMDAAVAPVAALEVLLPLAVLAALRAGGESAAAGNFGSA